MAGGNAKSINASTFFLMMWFSIMMLDVVVIVSLVLNGQYDVSAFTQMFVVSVLFTAGAAVRVYQIYNSGI